MSQVRLVHLLGLQYTLRQMLTIGRYKISSVVMARFRLDGGAMFGVVPKVLWEKLEPPDESNRIQLVMRSLLAVDPAAPGRPRVILVDSGAGTKWPPDEAARYVIEPLPEALPAALAQHDLTEADVTDVIVTHLHFDHNGGITEWAGSPAPQPSPLKREGATSSQPSPSKGEGTGAGRATRLRFPQARHWLHRRHWEYVDHPTEKDRASFLERDYEALRRAPLVEGRDGQPGLVLVDGAEPASIIDGIRWFVSRGHTPYQLLPIFEGADGDLLFTGDVIPTASHLRPAWVMAYDLEPLVTIAEKRRMLAACQAEGLQLAFPHDRQVAGARITIEKDRPTMAAKLELEP
ncbi:MAG TPA: MBL fold metallo-hydrolase [Phycisphaerae bacterium]